MSRHDPTLPTPDETVSESTLIARVKTAQDSNALMSLVNRHSGIYFNVVNRYASAYPNGIKARDWADDQLYNVYQFILAYDANRGTKLSTYIADRTDWLCKDTLKRDERNPISQGTYAASGVMPTDGDEDAYATSDGGYVTLEDPTVRVVEQANADLGLEDIHRAARETTKDPRFERVWDYRHNQHLSWREIGSRMNLSHEACRSLIYNATLDKAKARLVG